MKNGIVAFAFGSPSDINSNKLIAAKVTRVAKEFNAPVYTQLDIRLGSEIKVERINEIPGKPPTTLALAKGAIEWAKKNRINNLWIVAASPHEWRCERDIHMVMRDSGISINIRLAQEMCYLPDKRWFCVDSNQRRTRTANNWWNREFVLSILPFFIYKHIAS